MDNLTEKRLGFLTDTIRYYSDDVNRRCTTGSGQCYYNPASVNKQEISEGCAIGRHLPQSLKEKLDKWYGSEGAIEDVYEDDEETGIKPEEFPESLIDLGLKFLTDIQCLHDYENHWQKSGLTEAGKEYVDKIKDKYNLNPEQD